jgi:hypothetical protein
LKTTKRKKIGVKYCGGCNPTYERVEIIQRVQFRFGDRVLFQHRDEPDLDGLVVINGCPRACGFQNLEQKENFSYSITGESDFEALVKWLIHLNEKGDF